MDNDRLFMERFRDLLEDYNMTPAELGEKLGVSRSTVSRYMNCNIDMPVSKIKKMSEHFNVSPIWLMGLDDNKYIKEEEKDLNYIPLVGQVAAGIPIFAEQHIEEYINTRHNADFALRVKGDSMINARIYDGDIVYVKKQTDVKNGEIAVVLIDAQEATVKRIYKQGANIVLQPENPKYEPMVFSKSYQKDIKIIGKVVAVEIKF